MPEFKKNPSPFMLRSGNSPLFKMMGSSPVKQEQKKHFLEKEKVGPVENGEGVVTKNGEGKKKALKEVLAQQSSPDAKLGKISEGGVPPGEGDPFSGPEGGTGPVNPVESIDPKTYTKKKEKIKKKKGTWFGIGKDLGVTEAVGNVIDYLMPKR